MRMGKVVGTVVATQKNEKLRGSKLLIVEDVDLNGQPTGAYLVAVDAVGAGAGEVVLTCSGSSARLTDFTKDSPVDGTIIAIVETVEVGGEVRYKKEGKGVKVPTSPKASRDPDSRQRREVGTSRQQDIEGSR